MTADNFKRAVVTIVCVGVLLSIVVGLVVATRADAFQNDRIQRLEDETLALEQQVDRLRTWCRP